MRQIKYQAEIAMDEADVIVFVQMLVMEYSSRSRSSKYVYKTKKPVVLIVNKVDDINFKEQIYDFIH